MFDYDPSCIFRTSPSNIISSHIDMSFVRSLFAFISHLSRSTPASLSLFPRLSPSILSSLHLSHHSRSPSISVCIIDLRSTSLSLTTFISIPIVKSTHVSCPPSHFYPFPSRLSVSCVCSSMGRNRITPLPAGYCHLFGGTTPVPLSSDV